jgi:hypothetical protein
MHLRDAQWCAQVVDCRFYRPSGPSCVSKGKVQDGELVIYIYIKRLLQMSSFPNLYTDPSRPLVHPGQWRQWAVPTQPTSNSQDSQQGLAQPSQQAPSSTAAQRTARLKCALSAEPVFFFLFLNARCALHAGFRGGAARPSASASVRREAVRQLMATSRWQVVCMQ